jgi:hypothetical protein
VTTGMLIVLLVAIGLFLFFVLFMSMTAGRLDRLHRRIDVAELALDAQLLRRSGIALELAACGLLDPAASVVLSESAHAARRSTDLSVAERDLVESDLTAALNAALGPDDYAEVLSEQGGPELLAELSAAVKRVELSRRFLNDAVRACTQLRRQRSVRWFHLAGRTPWPVFREMSDHVDLGSG